jgi:uncharacterized membrane protein
MKINPLKLFRKNYKKIANSIAFYPALIAVGFLVLSFLMLEFDFSETGKHFKASFKWVRLRDTDTARTIVSTIIGGIISLTVFSFSMVMILLNQAASQMSNRTLESMISNRFHQFILGFYIGSIVYALSLLTTIRDIESGIYVPALSIYLLLLVTVTDIFLFIYFLHYVTQQVKFETIIKRIHEQSLLSLKKSCDEKFVLHFSPSSSKSQIVSIPESNYFQGFSEKQLASFAKDHRLTIQFLHPTGTYLIKGQPLLNIYYETALQEDEKTELLSNIDLFRGQPIEENYFYGFHQLAEIALRALSPGINDPETAVLSMHSLTDLFSYLLHHYIQSVFADKDGVARVKIQVRSFQSIFEECFYAIWDYGKKDRYIQNAMLQMVTQLQASDTQHHQTPLFQSFLKIIRDQQAKNEY